MGWVGLHYRTSCGFSGNDEQSFIKSEIGFGYNFSMRQFALFLRSWFFRIAGCQWAALARTRAFPPSKAQPLWSGYLEEHDPELTEEERGVDQKRAATAGSIRWRARTRSRPADGWIHGELVQKAYLSR